MNYLDFEKPIAELNEQIEKLKLTAAKSNLDVSKNIAGLEEKINAKRKEIFTSLTPWQRVQLSRHPDRPYSLDYIHSISQNTFLEFAGDRFVKEKMSALLKGKIAAIVKASSLGRKEQDRPMLHLFPLI